jgi:hypothetical protein
MKDPLLVAVIVGVFAQAAAASNFELFRSSDKMTDKDRSFIVATDSDSNRRLAFKCMEDGLNVIHIFDKYLMGESTGISVQYRFPPTPAPSPLSWNMLTNHKGAALPMAQVDSFIRKALTSKTVVLRVVDKDGDTLTSEYSLDGLTEGLSNLPCAQRFAVPQSRGKARKEADGKEETAHEASPALTLAAAVGDLERIRALLAAKADVSAKNKGGLTALMVAAGRGHTEVVRELIAAKAAVNAKDKGGRTALIFAAMEGHAEVARELIAAKADVNTKTEGGVTALMLSAVQGHTGVVRELIAAKADVNAKDKDGDTALRVAALEGHAEVVWLLKEAGAR